MNILKKNTRTMRGVLITIVAFVLIGFGLAACNNPAGPDKGGGDNGSDDVSYTVSFYADNESTEPSSKETVGKGKPAKGPEAPEKAGWFFDGWFTAKTGGTQVILGVTPVLSDMDLYEHWTKGYTVIFDTKGGSTVANALAYPGKPLAELPKNPTKTDFDFDGWFTDEEYTGESKVELTTPIVENETILYAKWVPAWMVQFDTHGGSEIAAVAVRNGNTAKRPETDPKKEGHDFAGWFDSATDGSEFDFDGTPITDNSTVHAQWTVQKRTVSFAMNGGTPQEQPQTVDWNTSAERPVTDPTKIGHDFDDWYTEEIGGEVFNFNTMKITEPTTIHARWNVKKFTVDFAMYGGTPQEQAQSVDWNTSAKRPTTDPTKTGYDFDNWYTAEEGGTVFNFNTTKITAATTIHARWTVKKLAVTFAMYGGTPQEQAQTVEWNTTAKRPVTDPTKTGHDFDDWYTAETGGEVFNFSTMKITAATTIHARWNIKKFTVDFAMNGGTPQENPQSVDWNTSAKRPTTDPTKTGYDFDNWYTEESGGELFNFNTTKITAATTIHARWTVKKLAVTFAMYGGTPQAEPQTVEWNDFAKRPTTNPTKALYDFDNWYTAETGGTVFNFSAMPITAATTIHARWIEKPGSGGFTIDLVDIIDEAANLPITGPTFGVLSSGQIIVNRADIGVESLEWRYNGKPVDPTAVSTSGNLTTLTLDKRVHGNKIGPHVLTLIVVINGEEYSKFVTFTVTL